MLTSIAPMDSAVFGATPLYIVDVYHQPAGYAQPVVTEQHRITARSDAEAIKQAQTIFAGRDA